MIGSKSSFGDNLKNLHPVTVTLLPFRKYSKVYGCSCSVVVVVAMSKCSSVETKISKDFCSCR